MFLPFVRAGAAYAATLLGIAAAAAMGYFKQLGDQLVAWGVLETALPSLSFTWIMPTALGVTITSAMLLCLIDPSARRDLAGLTWFSRKEKSSTSL
jgi:hypothetical protein